MMKALWRVAGRGIAVWGVLWAAVLLTGCQTNEAVFLPLPSELAATTRVGTSDVYRIGDLVSITYQASNPMERVLEPYSETIKEDGTIHPPSIGFVTAAGKTPGVLQKELEDKYKVYFKNLTVTIVSQGRYYYVIGEIRHPGPLPYLGETDILKAISAAGDFTDFANKKAVRLTHADGRTEVVNVLRAIDDPQYDTPIYPGDKIVVKRRWF